MTPYLLIAAFLVLFSTVAKRLSSTILTAPMVFLGLGVALNLGGLVPEAATERALHLMAEITLIVLLFLDAARVDHDGLKHHSAWPVRMLVIGIPLCFAFGWVAGWLLLPGWPLAMVALIAAILVPTDAALGDAVISNRDVPERHRRALTVESGLNDGLALPLVLMMAAFAAPAGAAPEGGWTIFAARQVLLGPLVGVSIGALGGLLLLKAQAARATDDVHEGIGTLALAACCYLAAGAVGGNGFVAAFTGGFAFGAVVRGACAFVYEFTESEGKLLSWGAFLLLGAVLVPEAASSLTLPHLALILVSLFILRPVAIWLSLTGTDADPLTRGFFGWFGPRGLATALFALLVVDELQADWAEAVLNLAINAVWISALLHGMTAAPLARWFGRQTG